MFSLYNESCLDYMAGMADSSVDAVITDPPYDERTHAGAVTHGGEDKTTDLGVGEFSHLVNQEVLVSEFLRVSKSWCLVFCTFEDMGKWRDGAWKTGAWVRAGVWDRINPAPQFTGDRPSQACDGLAIFHNPNKKKQWNGGGHSAIWRASVEFGKKEHPTQKPLKLMRKLVSDFTNPGDVVFDPFMGSGTTGVACMELGRHFIGCEISQEYFKIAERRLDESSRQLGLL